MRKNSNPKNLVYRLLYSESFETPAAKWGEPVARNVYEEKKKVQVSLSGLIIDPKNPWLAESPDGIIDNSSHEECGIIEIKCPYAGRVMTRGNG